METFMNECTEEMAYDVIGATTQAVERQDDYNVSWFMSVSVRCSAMASIIPLTKGQIKQDQRTDPTIGPVIQCKLAQENHHVQN